MWLHAVVSITKNHDGDGKTAGMAALSAHPSLKHVIVVDDDIDPDNMVEVEWAIATRLQADRGLVVVPYARGSTLDPSAREGITTKLIIDATVPVSERSKYVRPRIPTASPREDGRSGKGPL
jgi:UbiD family decarboxylase